MQISTVQTSIETAADRVIMAFTMTTELFDFRHDWTLGHVVCSVVAFSMTPYLAKLRSTTISHSAHILNRWCILAMRENAICKLPLRMGLAEHKPARQEGHASETASTLPEILSLGRKPLPGLGAACSDYGAYAIPIYTDSVNAMTITTKRPVFRFHPPYHDELISLEVALNLCRLSDSPDDDQDND